MAAVQLAFVVRKHFVPHVGEVLQLLDEDNRRAMIIETKKSDSAAEMENDCRKALKQIVDEEYARNLDEGYETVLCYGIAFFKKTALIRKL